MKKLAAVIAILVLCSTVYGTLAELDNAPSWRTSPAGQDSTTYQAWTFSNGANPAIADVDENSFGTPTLEITTTALTTMHLQTYNGRSGVWKIQSADLIDIYIPNTGNNDPGTWKELWMQIIYADPYGDGFDIPIATDPLYDSLRRESSRPLGDGFILETYSIIFEPNPNGESIKLMAIQANIYISAISVDTRYIPEPTTICLLGLGALGLLRKRRA